MSRSVVQIPATPSSPLLSHAIVANGFVFASGQVGRDLATRKAADGVAAQTRQCLENLRAVLGAAGAGMKDVVKTTVFLVDAADFAAMNAVYATYFPDSPPARSTVESRLMSKDLLVEIEAVAVLP